MSYIGNTVENQNYVPAIDYFNGDGSTTAFTLSRPVASVAAVQAVISNVPQNPGSAFTVSGSTITFTSAPPSGTANIYVYYTSPNTSVATLAQNPVITGTATFGSSLTYGASGLLASFASNTNGYNQVVLQNASSGASASSDLIVSNNSGTDSTNYGDFGINGSGFSGSGAFSDASGVYMYAQTGTMAVGTVGAQSLKLATNNTVQATIDSSGNVVVGATTAQDKLAVQGSGATNIRVGSSTNASYRGFVIGADPTDSQQYGYMKMELNSGQLQIGAGFAGWGGLQTFYTNGSERMRINSSGQISTASSESIVGQVQAGLTSSIGSAVNGIVVSCASSAGPYPFAAKGTSSSQGLIGFFNESNAVIGSVTRSGSNVAYNTSSDYRLKENIQPMQGALDVVAQLNPVTYTWKADGSDGQGFIAHELQAVVPDCVTGEKDAVDADGNPIYQGIDTSFLVATLTAAIQELNAKVDAQAAEIAALKGAK